MPIQHPPVEKTIAVFLYLTNRRSIASDPVLLHRAFHAARTRSPLLCALTVSPTIPFPHYPRLDTALATLCSTGILRQEDGRGPFSLSRRARRSIEQRLLPQFSIAALVALTQAAETFCELCDAVAQPSAVGTDAQCP